MTKNSRIASGIFTAVLVIGLIVGSAFAIKNSLTSHGVGQTVKDEKALFIGVEKEHDGQPVALSFRLIDGTQTLIDKTYMSNQSEWMIPADGQNEDLVFHDFTDDIAPYIGDSLFYWLNGATGWRDHKIIVNTTCLNGSIRSSDFFITDAGIYFIGVAERNGEPPFSTSYAAVKRETVLGETT